MSQATALKMQSNPRIAPLPAETRPRIALVKPPKSGGSLTPWIISYALVLLLSLAVVLAMNLSMANTAYKLHAINQEVKELVEVNETLKVQVLSAQSPQTLLNLARRAGMVPGSDVAIINLADKTIKNPALKVSRR